MCLYELDVSFIENIFLYYLICYSSPDELENFSFFQKLKNESLDEAVICIRNPFNA